MPALTSHFSAASPQRRRTLGIAVCVGSVAAVTGAIYLLRDAVPVLSLGALYVLAVLPAAAGWGRAYAVPVAIASMLAFNFLFLQPVHTFTLVHRANWFALAVYLAVALVVSDLAARSRRRAAEAEQREREEALLGELSLSLLRGEPMTDGLDRIGAAAAAVLGVERARVELGPPRDPPPGESPLELRAGDRRVGTLYVQEAAAANLAIRERFLPALASLLAVAADRERLEREALAAESLRLSDSLKTAILRAVSHDLRSPLTAIRVAAESLASPSVHLDEADRTRQLDTVRTESRRLDRLVGNLLDLSRLQAGAAAPERSLVAVDELVSRALAELGPERDRVRVELSAELPLVEVDPGQIERVLANLLENALAFSPPDAQVLVRVTPTRKEAILRVVDRGLGIPQDELERVFEPFERSSGAAAGGSGLGLAIARGFTEANGGRIWAESRPEQGASLAVAFPLAPVPAGSSR